MENTVTGLVPFWDDSMIDARYTDATLSVNPLQRREPVMRFDKPWEGRSTCYFNIIRDGDLYRMYYLGWTYTDNPITINVCYAESRDGIRWERPSLGICEYNGSKDNNMIIMGIHDNFTVMKDENPSCPPEMRYKALMMVHVEKARALQALVSADGLHFTPHAIISDGYHYDTQNTLLWNPHTKKYYCFIRDVHRAPCDEKSRCNEHDVRGIRVMESSDFAHWTEPAPLSFGGSEDYPLYTNCVFSYPYDTRYYVGFPTRYVERRAWSGNYDRLCGKEARLDRMKLHPRYGLVVTDCVFMSSRDGYNWHRFDEAILTPGIENGDNWVYGDGYPACGELVVTPSAYENEPDELSLYVYDKHWTATPTNLIRYTCRRDGFASFKAPYAPKTLKTKPFLFDGSVLSLNFRTSARGGIILRILDEYSHPIEGYTTCELFGDSVERIVDFDKELSLLCGRKVIFEFTMSDAEIFSMKFSN
jgi:hypothetical protein